MPVRGVHRQRTTGGTWKRWKEVRRAGSRSSVNGRSEMPTGSVGGERDRGEPQTIHSVQSRGCVHPHGKLCTEPPGNAVEDGIPQDSGRHFHIVTNIKKLTLGPRTAEGLKY